MKVLVTGGAGYKGIKIVEALLARGCEVSVVDTFYFGFTAILHLATNPNLHIYRKDVRDDLRALVSEHDVIIHLAGLSGFPACVANPGVAIAVNVDATERLVKTLSKDQLLLFASTTAMYEVAPEVEVDEATVLHPVGMYTKTKLMAENICLNEHPNTIALRLATVMGVAPRMRSNLLVNDFTSRAINDRSLVLYHADAKRTFIHIDDCVRGYMMSIDRAQDMRGGIFNVGSNALNYSKRQIAEEIAKHVECDIIVSKAADKDSRNFTVSFAKIRSLGYDVTISLEDTVKELVKLYRFYRPGPGDESQVF